MIPLSNTQILAIQSICQRHFVSSLYLFGSATGESFDEKYSDIDLVVDFNDQLQPLDFADNFFSLMRSLEDLFGRDVDLLSYRALKNPIMIEEIENSKVSLYAA